jgi:hypothetical protein
VTENQIILMVADVALLIHGLKLMVRDLEYYSNILLECSATLQRYRSAVGSFRRNKTVSTKSYTQRSHIAHCRASEVAVSWNCWDCNGGYINVMNCWI